MSLLQEIKVPLLSVNDTTLTISECNFSQGAAVKKGEIVMVFETSKTTYDVVAETDGFIAYECQRGDECALNEVVAKIFSEVANVPEQKKVISKKSNNTTKQSLSMAKPIWKGDILFTADALALMEKSKLDSKVFEGFEMVSRSDVEEKLGIKKKGSPDHKTPTKSSFQLPIDTEKVSLVPLSGNKKREIEYLSQVQASGLTSTVHMVIETEGMFTNLNQHVQYFKNSLLPLVVFESARLLKKHTIFNAFYTGDAIAHYKEVNIGFAIDLENRGLKVLKIRHADSESLNGIEEKILELSNKYIDNQLELGDMTEITFTITDLSGEGVLLFKPLVNAANSSILGISAIDHRFNRCMLSLTFDHRITEGKQAALFLQELKERLESYRSSFHASSSDIHCFKCLKGLKEDLGDVGFMKCVTPSGSEAYICQSCFKGF